MAKINQEVFEAEIAKLRGELEASEARGAALAAGQCIVPRGLLGDDWGHQYCDMQKQLAASEALCAELLASAQADRELDNHYVHHQGCTTDCQVRANLWGGVRFLRVHALAKAEGVR
jgi:hypothetical protein